MKYQKRYPKISVMQQTDRVDSLTSGSELHGYIVERVLGSGAFGITYLVRHSFLDSRYVIKEYLPECAMREHGQSTISPKSAGNKELFDWEINQTLKISRKACYFDKQPTITIGES